MEIEVESNLKRQIDQKIAEKLIIQNRNSLGQVVVELQQSQMWRQVPRSKH